MLRRLLGSGVLATASASTGFAVSERAAGANMSVDVAAGDAFVRGHYMTSAATVNLAVTTADGSEYRRGAWWAVVSMPRPRWHGWQTERRLSSTSAKASCRFNWH
jgi:hypothetical protein